MDTLRTKRWGAALLVLVTGGIASAVPDASEEVGTPDDSYWIPEGYFAPGVPAVGTLEQQMMMADAVAAMWALGDDMLADIEAFGEQAVMDLDAFIAMGAEEWEVYDAAVELEDEIDEHAWENHYVISDHITIFFLPVQNSTPAPPTELLTAAFGPSLSSIARVHAEADYWILEVQARRPMERPDEPDPPIVAFTPPPPAPVVAAAPEPEPDPVVASEAQASEAQALEAQASEAQASEAQEAEVVGENDPTAFMTPKERKRYEKRLEKQRKKAIKAERQRQKRIEKQRKRAEKLERQRQKRIEKQRRKAEKLERKRLRQTARLNGRSGR